MNKNRNPFIASLLSLIMPGFGQIYNTQLQKGLILFLSGYLMFSVLALLKLQYSLAGLIIIFLTEIAYALFVAIDAFIVAKRKGDTELKSYNRWPIYILLTLVFWVLNSTVGNAIQQNIYSLKAYKIPAGSMIPSVDIGDHLMVDLKAYQTKKPTTGDIIIFQYPPKPEQDFIKRVVATGGQQIQILNKVVYVNEQPIDEPYVIHRDIKEIPAEISPRDNMGPITVPVNSYFVLGDNRDNSHDSRFWGFVSEEAIKGKALYFYWSKYKSKIGSKII